LKEGMLADLLVVEKNPLDDVTVLKDQANLRLIMKDGLIYKDTFEKNHGNA
jgi:imidazolonepropionase-like amidohydrolase